MKEIGGYIEFETNHRGLLHNSGIKLNCGRNCLAYLILAKQIKKLAVPYFMCSSVFGLCRKYGVELKFYHVGMDFRPAGIQLERNEWLYLMNFYGQLTVEEMEGICGEYKRVIIDFSHDYFREPIAGGDTIYTCRKFFGVPDGAILYTDAKEPDIEIPVDESFERMHFLLGRFERPASEFYEEYVSNNELFANEPIKKMSALTENILRGIDYKSVEKRRTENYRYLHAKLCAMNQLELRNVTGAFAYPLMVEHGDELKTKLISRKIFIPTLWPNVLEEMVEGSMEYRMANNILPIPCDQRYTCEDMEYIISNINGCMRDIDKGHMEW